MSITIEQLRDIFTSVVKGRNFVTPEFVGYYEIKDGVAELTTGSRMMGSIPYGVTVVSKNEQGTYFSNYSISKCCLGETKEEAYKEAIEYIKSLQ